MKRLPCAVLSSDRVSKNRFIVNAVVVSALLLFSGLIPGCGGGGGGNATVNPPSGLSYSQTAIVAMMNEAISSDMPTVTGTVTLYAVSPALPAGLSLSASTGMISGTPAALAAKASYTVTASNSGGSTTTSIQITVNPQPPSKLSYSQSSITGIVDQAISPDTPTVTGTVTSYAVSPAIPKGLSLDSSTGVISGTPTALAAKASYTVTASNSSGSTTASIQVTVNPGPPSKLSYSQSSIAGFVNQAISPDTPTITGTDVSYAVSPALPTGLSLNSSTGVISGTPASTSQASYTVTASNAGGSTTTSIEITVTVGPPVGLTYTEPSISAVVNQTITPDVPAVTGTVTAYAVSPQLPIGLGLDPDTGIISGTPDNEAGASIYTVTASNSGGSTSAAIQIAVAMPLPPGITYPAPIATYVGHEIMPDIPGTSGGLSSFTVSPALPAGLSLDPATGIIMGTPTAGAGQAAYTVTGSSADGSVNVTTSVDVTVTPAPNILLQLGNEYTITTLRYANSSVLSQDLSGFWILWNYKSGAILASGESSSTDMAGPTLVIQVPGGFQFRSSADGHVLSTFPSPGGFQGGGAGQTWSWQLASDGSYISVETPLGLYAYNPSGQLLFSRTGYYYNQFYPNPINFAAPGQVQIANGPGGPNAIETVSVPGGVSVVSPPYQDTFQAWFADGGRFLTAVADPTCYSQPCSSPVWIYSSSGVQQASVSLPVSGGYGGAGNWIWTTSWEPLFPPTGGGSVSIYPINSATPALTVSSADLEYDAPSGTSLALLYDDNTLSVIDLSGTTPVQTDYTIPPVNHASVMATASPTPGVDTFAALSANQWVAGIGSCCASPSSGLIVDGASLPSSNPRYLGIGAALSIAGSSNNVAIATAGGQIFYFDPASTTSQGSVSLTGGNVQLSSDGSVLAASSQDDSLLNVYSLPSGTLSNSFAFTAQSAPGLLTDFNLAASGATIAQIETFGTSGSSPGYSLEIEPVSGSPTILSLAPSPSGTVLLSPDGTLAALNVLTVQTTSMQSNYSFSVPIYQNGQLIATLGDVAVGWIDNGRLLLNQYVPNPQDAYAVVYSGCTIVSPTGATVASCSLPELQSIQPVTSDEVYVPNQNTIYSLTTGQATWTSPYPPDPPWISGGAISGPYVVFEWQGQVIAVMY
ncbi:MAG: putative Ig domain-containing protein [Terracidiphilus sp.]